KLVHYLRVQSPLEGYYLALGVEDGAKSLNRTPLQMHPRCKPLHCRRIGDQPGGGACRVASVLVDPVGSVIDVLDNTLGEGSLLSVGAVVVSPRNLTRFNVASPVISNSLVT